jgi:protocatechuate 3,4-dioxygenase beta subunit
MITTALLALLLQTPTATVSGVVLNANGEPVPNIRVTLGKFGNVPTRLVELFKADFERSVSGSQLEDLSTLVDENGAPPSETVTLKAAFKALPVKEIYELNLTADGVASVVYKSAAPVMTDERGRFSFPTVGPGSYRLTFSGNGYAKHDYKQLEIAAGQSKSDIVTRMMKVAAISGRVLETNGQPVAGAPVELYRFTYDETGQKKKQLVAGTRTDDLGDYRLHTLSPGFYYISGGGQLAGPEGTPPGLRERVFGGGYTSPNRLPQFSTTMFYSRADNEASATTIDLQSGADLRGIDFFVSLPRPFRVRGRVVDARTGKPPQRATFSLNLQDSGPRGSVNLIENVNPGYNPEDGSFVLQNINGRPYYLIAMIPDAQPQRFPPPDAMSTEEIARFFEAREAAELARPKAALAVNVNADVDGLVFVVTPGGPLKGRLRVESNENVDLSGVRFQLKHPFGIALNGVVAADGAWRVNNVRPADYLVSVSKLPEGFYLKEARLGQIDVLNAPLRYAEGDTSPLDFVISSKVGSIEGTTSPGATVALIPNKNRERSELFRSAVADSAGRFTIRDVAPGEYSISAWEVLEPFGFFDPNVIREAEKRGKTVRVDESSKQTVTLTQP